LKPFFYLLLLGSHLLSAQGLKWNQGSVVLASGSVITGQISMTSGQNLILFKGVEVKKEAAAETTAFRQGAESLPAHKLKAVFFYDDEANINRRFIAAGDRKVFPGVQLYEVVLQGSIDVLRRPRTLSSSSTESKDFDYYCSDHKKLVPLWRFYREVYPAIEVRSRQQLTAFIKANNLQHGDDANLITIIGYYNKMAKAEQAFARQ
jgi:hypothetical protein